MCTCVRTCVRLCERARACESIYIHALNRVRLHRSRDCVRVYMHNYASRYTSFMNNCGTLVANSYKPEGQ